MFWDIRQLELQHTGQLSPGGEANLRVITAAATDRHRTIMATRARPRTSVTSPLMWTVRRDTYTLALQVEEVVFVDTASEPPPSYDNPTLYGAVQE